MFNETYTMLHTYIYVRVVVLRTSSLMIYGFGIFQNSSTVVVTVNGENDLSPVCPDIPRAIKVSETTSTSSLIDIMSFFVSTIANNISLPTQ